MFFDEVELGLVVISIKFGGYVAKKRVLRSPLPIPAYFVSDAYLIQSIRSAINATNVRHFRVVW